MLTNLNRIDKNHIPWMSQILIFFFLLAKYNQHASTCNSSFKRILARDKITQIHTVTLIVTSLLCNGTIHCTFSSHRLVHNKLPRCCTMLSFINQIYKSNCLTCHAFVLLKEHLTQIIGIWYNLSYVSILNEIKLNVFLKVCVLG